jgi:DNA-binding XRE family transcriptional regulator
MIGKIYTYCKNRVYNIYEGRFDMYFSERECLKAMFDVDIRTWKELLEKTGISRKTLYNIRVGASVPTLEACYAIKKVLKLDGYKFFKVFPYD